MVTFDVVSTKARRIGVQLDRHIVDITTADSTLPNDMKTFLTGGVPLFERAKKIADSGKHRLPFSDVKITAPIWNPEKIVCVGLNYRDHAAESNMPIPPEPVLFSKFPSTIIGTGDNIVKPAETNQLDYEAELVIVVGKGGRNIPEKDALQHVAGYTCGNDVSARDWQLTKPGGQWMTGKTWDTFAPIGPNILINPILLQPNDSFDPNSINVRCYVNGRTVQNSNTREFIFNVQTVLAYISKIVTLKPGDLIFTGTPPGVGMGLKPPTFLSVGDRVRVEVDEIGAVENAIVAPQQPAKL
jgi:2-keto-4-pentenoate hydratase/2-oxohepta-3-ene-1,7-dioic acid hydratase in catechol pathway